MQILENDFSLRSWEWIPNLLANSLLILANPNSLKMSFKTSIVRKVTIHNLDIDRGPRKTKFSPASKFRVVKSLQEYSFFKNYYIDRALRTLCNHIIILATLTEGKSCNFHLKKNKGKKRSLFTPYLSKNSSVQDRKDRVRFSQKIRPFTVEN